jgi:hypothetical protein
MSYLNYNDLRNLINESYEHLRPVLSQALIQAVNSAEERGEQIQHPLWSLITNFVSPVVADTNAIRSYMDDERTRESVTRRIFSPFLPLVPPSIFIPADAIEVSTNPMPEGIDEARAPGMPSESAVQDFPALFAAVADRRAAQPAQAAEPSIQRNVMPSINTMSASISRFMSRFPRSRQ